MPIIGASGTIQPLMISNDLLFGYFLNILVAIYIIYNPYFLILFIKSVMIVYNYSIFTDTCTRV